MKKIKIIALVGKAGSGKDYWLRYICENNEDVHEIISCTTRPPRPSELDGINYHFLTKEEFLKEKYVEYCEFNNWYYGTREKDLSKDELNLGVFNLSGIEALLKNPEINLFVIYLKTDDKIRLIRQLQRDSSDIQEIFRRYQADEKDFDNIRIDNIKKKVPIYYVINNSTGDYDDNEFIRSDLDEIIEEVKSA